MIHLTKIKIIQMINHANKAICRTFWVDQFLVTNFSSIQLLLGTVPPWLGKVI